MMNILLATDGSSHSQAAGAVLRRLPFPPDVELTLVTVVEQGVFQASADEAVPDEDRNLLERLYTSRRHQADRLLAQEAARFDNTGWMVRAIQREGNIAQQILETADELGADLIVVGAQGLSNLNRFLLGSVSQKVVKYAPCSVLVAKWHQAEEPAPGGVASRAGETGARWRILLAYDGSPQAQAAVDTLAALPLGDRSEVTVTTVLTLVTAYRMDIVQQLSEAWQKDKQAARAALDTVAQALRQATPHVTTQLREGADPSEEILTAAEEAGADLIVLGHKGKGGVKRFLLGSTAHRAAHYAPCSVWIVKT